jgi:hypothetical protein
VVGRLNYNKRTILATKTKMANDKKPREEGGVKASLPQNKDKTAGSLSH